MLAKLGIPVPCSDLFGAFGLTWLDGLKPPQRYAGKVASLRQLNPPPGYPVAGFSPTVRRLAQCGSRPGMPTRSRGRSRSA